MTERRLCVECEGPATYSHIEDTVTIYSCEHHCCSACTALDGARDSLMATLTALRDRLREQHLHGADALDAAIERLAAIKRVRELHRVHRCRMSTQHTDCFITYGGECNYADKCAVCRTKYPCQTIRALGGRQEWHP